MIGRHLGYFGYLFLDNIAWVCPTSFFEYLQTNPKCASGKRNQVLQPAAIDGPEAQQACHAILVHRHCVQHRPRVAEGECTTGSNRRNKPTREWQIGWPTCQRSEEVAEPDLGREECGGRARSQAPRLAACSRSRPLPIHHRPSRCLDSGHEHWSRQLQRRHPWSLWVSSRARATQAMCTDAINSFVTSLMALRQQWFAAAGKK